LLAQVIVQEVMLYSVYGSMGFHGHLFEARPNKNGTANMVSDNPSFSALITFNPGQLLGFAVKLLDFPAEVRHISDNLHVVLRYFVGDDIVRALCRMRIPVMPISDSD
jgi:hypothetical protein